MGTQPSARPQLQDACRVDSRHYTVELENDKVRVIRARYGPHEKSVMHGHPQGFAIALTDATVRFTYPDGRTEDVTMRPGQVVENPSAYDHNPENLGDRAFEVLVVELKS